MGGKKKARAKLLTEAWLKGSGQPLYQQWRSEICSTSPSVH